MNKLLCKENPFQKKSIIKDKFLITPLFFFSLYFLIWPLVWHLIFLPKSQPSLHGFRVEPSVQIGSPEFPERHFFPGNFFNLDQPNSSLFAYAVWAVPQGGSYRIRMTCDDNGQVIIDNRPVVILSGISSSNQGEGTVKLKQGKHLIKVRLNNVIGKGWMKIEEVDPGHEAFQPLHIKDLNFIKLGNIDTWLLIVFWVENLSLLGFIVSCFLGIVLPFFRKNQIKLFPNKKWLVLFLILGLVASTISGIYFTKQGLPPIWGDGLGYYSYLPAYLIYHDPSMKSLFGPTRGYGYPPEEGNFFDPGEGFYFYPSTGRYLIKYPMGTAVMTLPFFLLGHLAAPFLGFIQDGFSPPYQFAVVISAIFYMLGGLYILFKIMIRHFSSNTILITLLYLLFGTNLLTYGTIEPFSHVYSFFLICMLLYHLPTWYDDPSMFNTFLLGAVSGMIPLVRNPNAYILLIIPLYGISSWPDIKSRWQFFGQNKMMVFLFGLTVILLFLPQSLIWKYATNHFFIKAYVEEKMNFLSPHLFKVLFSFHHGLFIYSPMLLFGIIGFGMMKESLKSYRLPLIFGLFLGWYVISSWYLWYYGWSFGHRAFIDIYAFFAIPLVCFIDSSKNKIYKKSISLIIIIFIILNSYLFIQYMERILPGEKRPNITMKDYRDILLNPAGVQSIWQWLKDPKVNNRRVWGQSHPQLFSNK